MRNNQSSNNVVACISGDEATYTPNVTINLLLRYHSSKFIQNYDNLFVCLTGRDALGSWWDQTQSKCSNRAKIVKKAYQTCWPSGSGVTRDGWGGRVAHPWKVWGKFWKEGGNDGRGKKERKGPERQGKRENGEGKEGKIVEENLKLKGERYKMSRGLFFCLSLFETTKICLGCTKMEIF